MAQATEFIKDPDAVLDWHFDWQPWLQIGESISSSLFLVTAGLTMDSSSNTSTNATVWLSGGNPGQPYRVTNRIITNQGRTDDRSITIRVKDR